MTARNSVLTAAESDKVSDVIHFAPISPASDHSKALAAGI
jgi:hypothetical protein